MDLDGFLASANLAHHGEGLVALGCTEVADLHELTDDDCAASAAMKPLEIRRMRRKLHVDEDVAGNRVEPAAHVQELIVPDYTISSTGKGDGQRICRDNPLSEFAGMQQQRRSATAPTAVGVVGAPGRVNVCGTVMSKRLVFGAALAGLLIVIVVAVVVVTGSNNTMANSNNTMANSNGQMECPVGATATRSRYCSQLQGFCHGGTNGRVNHKYRSDGVATQAACAAACDAEPACVGYAYGTSGGTSTSACREGLLDADGGHQDSDCCAPSDFIRTGNVGCASGFNYSAGPVCCAYCVKTICTPMYCAVYGPGVNIRRQASCPERCKSCRAGGVADGGIPLTDGVCAGGDPKAYCSTGGNCGTTYWYRQGTDCSACPGGRGWHGQTSPITTIDGADSDSRAVCVAVKGRN